MRHKGRVDKVKQHKSQMVGEDGKTRIENVKRGVKYFKSIREARDFKKELELEGYDVSYFVVRGRGKVEFYAKKLV